MSVILMGILYFVGSLFSELLNTGVYKK